MIAGRFSSAPPASIMARPRSSRLPGDRRGPAAGGRDAESRRSRFREWEGVRVSFVDVREVSGSSRTCSRERRHRRGPLVVAADESVCCSAGHFEIVRPLGSTAASSRSRRPHVAETDRGDALGRARSGRRIVSQGRRSCWSREPGRARRAAASSPARRRRGRIGAGEARRSTR